MDRSLASRIMDGGPEEARSGGWCGSGLGRGPVPSQAPDWLGDSPGPRPRGWQEGAGLREGAGLGEGAGLREGAGLGEGAGWAWPGAGLGSRQPPRQGEARGAWGVLGPSPTVLGAECWMGSPRDGGTRRQDRVSATAQPGA